MNLIKITSPTGSTRDVTITDVASGAQLEAGINRIMIDADDGHINAQINAVECSLDLLAHVNGVTMNDEFCDIPINKKTHRFEIVKETEDAMTLRIIRHNEC